MAEFLDMKPKLHAELTRSVMAADVALVVVNWSLEAPSADGSSVFATGKSADVLRRGWMPGGGTSSTIRVRSTDFALDQRSAPAYGSAQPAVWASSLRDRDRG